MDELKIILSQQLPAEFSISQSAGYIVIRDSNQPREQGFRIGIEEDSLLIQASLTFEDFAGPLMQVAGENIVSRAGSAAQLLRRSDRLRITRNRMISEKLFTDALPSEHFWWLRIDYDKNSWTREDMMEFADVIIYWIFFLFPYRIEGEQEGGKQENISSVYERSRVNRSICLALHGHSCLACGLNMRSRYGMDRDFIHVHHVLPVSSSGIRAFDPLRDLVPLCPNCHAVAHLKNPPYTVDEIKLMLDTNDNIQP